jgi:hypothetical protein
MSNVIKIPVPTKDAYNPGRPLEKNLLVKAQVEHFREAEAQLPKRLRTNIDVSQIRTEGEASEYIRLVTQALHTAGGRRRRKTRAVR